MKIRPSALEDFDTVENICRRNGLLLDKDRDGWQRFWTENPRLGEFGDMPTGWILENDRGEAVGTLSNIPVAYEYNGRRLSGVTASSWAVDPEYRSASLMLIRAFFRQENIDLFLNTTANNKTGAIFSAFHARPVPQPMCDRISFWITDYASFAASALSARTIPCAKLLKYPGAAALWGMDLWKRRGARARPASQVSQLAAFDERFDVFWQRLRRRENRLVAVRDRRTLDWHFRVARKPEQAAILALERDGDLVGYAIVTAAHNRALDLRRFRISDLQVLERNAGDVPRLVAGALAYARDSGGSVLEAIGFSELKRAEMEGLKPRTRKMASHPFYYKAAASDLRAKLEDLAVWDVCPYDGDASLFDCEDLREGTAGMPIAPSIYHADNADRRPFPHVR